MLLSTLMLASVFAGCLDLDTIAPPASGEDGAAKRWVYQDGFIAPGP